MNWRDKISADNSKPEQPRGSVGRQGSTPQQSERNTGVDGTVDHTGNRTTQRPVDTDPDRREWNGGRGRVQDKGEQAR